VNLGDGGIVVTEQERQAIVDEEYLRLLPIGYWVSAGFWAAYGLFMIAYFGFFGLLFATVPSGGSAAGAPPRELAWFFLAWAVLGLLVGGALVAAKILAGFWLRQRKRRIATMVVAGLSCFEVPYGTVLGVLTFIALARPSVRALYEGKRAMPSGETVEGSAGGGAAT
jgi:hypothetical protein